MNIIDYLAEQKIQEAMNNGEFNELPGCGKPIANSEYFSVPGNERVAFLFKICDQT